MKKALYIASLIIALALMVMGALGVFGCTAQAQSMDTVVVQSSDTLRPDTNIGKSLSQVYEEVWSETKADNAVVIAPDWPTWVPYAILGLAAVGLIALVVKILT